MKKMLILFLLPVLAFGQQDNIWYFGERAGLDFSSGTPQVLTDSQMDTREGCATVSGLSDGLLFYTNGVTVWDRDHQVMQNGTGLLGDVLSSQSALVVQKPGQYHIYYIFTAAAALGPAGISYSEVDMTAANGLGAVTLKNVPLLTPACEKLTAGLHSNGIDVWVIAHGWLNNSFYSYRITGDGVNTAPLVSNSGDVLDPGGENIPPYKGCMKLSHDGKRLAVANFGRSLQLFDFDAQTGMVSNPMTMANDWFGSFYGLEFSPSNNILYAGMRYKIRQYYLLAANPSTAVTDWIGAESQYGAVQLGPDNKIYVANHHVSVINNPDIVGNGCDLDLFGIDVGGNVGNSAVMSLPFFISQPNALDIAFSGTCMGSEVAFSMLSSKPQDSATWDLGDGTTATGEQVVHTFTQPGTYIVKMTATRGSITGEIHKTVVVVPGPAIGQPDDMRSCDTGNGTAIFDLASHDVMVLNGEDSATYVVTYHLSAEDAATGDDPLPSEYTNTANPQTIYARLASNMPGGCYATTTFDIEAVKPDIAMPDTYGLCDVGSVTLTAPEGFEDYLWSTGETTSAITVSSIGDYTITVHETLGDDLCEATKTITVYRSEQPVIKQVLVDDWTDDTNKLTAIVEGTGDYEYSIDNAHFQEAPEFTGLESGLYTIFVHDRNGCGNASKEVAVLMYPRYFTPNSDGHHDTWQVDYAYFEPEMLINIFDRYGKAVASFEGRSSGWDGKFNGHDLPATDYWFVVKRQDGRQHRGHFSILR